MSQTRFCMIQFVWAIRWHELNCQSSKSWKKEKRYHHLRPRSWPLLWTHSQKPNPTFWRNVAGRPVVNTNLWKTRFVVWEPGLWLPAVIILRQSNPLTCKMNSVEVLLVEETVLKPRHLNLSENTISISWSSRIDSRAPPLCSNKIAEIQHSSLWRWTI